ncbi:MAG: aminotransferase class IV [Actinobacteria bacterium]|nr:aminotransferase class IV [Actinomycetota bacterium]
MPWGTHQSVPDARNESVLVYVNGRLVPRHRASVSVFDSGFLVGDGVWEGLRLHRGRFLHADRHFDRLFATAAAVGLDIGKTREELLEILTETARRNHMETDVHVRLMITRGTKQTPSQDPRLTASDPTIVVIAEYKVADPAVVQRGIRLRTAAVRRPPPQTLDQRWNCHSKIHEVAALNQALAAGADEALMLDINGHVATCNATNFFIVTGGEVWTSTGEHCLNGITRGLVIEVGREAGIRVLEKDFVLDDVYAADEAFVTGTFGGLTPVIEVDGRQIGDGAPGPMTARLTGLYHAALEQEARS